MFQSIVSVPIKPALFLACPSAYTKNWKKVGMHSWLCHLLCSIKKTSFGEEIDAGNFLHIPSQFILALCEHRTVVCNFMLRHGACDLFWKFCVKTQWAQDLVLKRCMKKSCYVASDGNAQKQVPMTAVWSCRIYGCHTYKNQPIILLCKIHDQYGSDAKLFHL